MNEFEKFCKLVLNILSQLNQNSESSSDHIKGLEQQFISLITVEFDQRLKLLQPSNRVIQPVLCMRRILLSQAESMFKSVQNNCADILTHIRQEIGNCWLKSIAVARK